MLRKFDILVCISIVSIFNVANLLSAKDVKPVCSMSMYNDSNAYIACRTIDALQNNWFPSPIAGLYSYLDWNGFDGFWQNGAVLETIANFLHYTNSTRYHKVLKASWRSLEDLVHAYYPLPSCDDELWFGLAFARIYEVIGDERFLNTSQEIFNFTVKTCWDYQNQCYGGMFFGGGHHKKITITNAQTLLLGAKLFRLTGISAYLDRSLDVVNYLEMNHVVHPVSSIVSDSIDVYTCKANVKTNYTYNSGMIIGGLVQLYMATNKSGFLERAHVMAKANIHNLSKNGILTEYCDIIDNCDNDLDAHMFKGIFVRSIRYLMDVSEKRDRKFYKAWINSNIDQILKNAVCGLDSKSNISSCNMSFIEGEPTNNLTGPVFTTNWHGPYDFSAPEQQTQVLDLLISGIVPGTDCMGDKCNYDPDIKPIEKLTCADNPCPISQDCCSWTPKYTTCCAPYQICYQGGCY